MTTRNRQIRSPQAQGSIPPEKIRDAVARVKGVPKERPIIFTANEVRAALDGRKSATRRVVKPQPTEHDDFDGPHWYHPTRVDRSGEEYPGEAVFGIANEDQGWPCPYGSPGERLWVRETWWHHKECRPPFEHQRESCVRYNATEPPERRD